MKKWRVLYLRYIPTAVDPSKLPYVIYFDGNNIEWDDSLFAIPDPPYKHGWVRVQVNVTDEEASVILLKFG
jgi:hypothetical protein